jgi:solute carrier family 35 protein E3
MDKKNEEGTSLVGGGNNGNNSGNNNNSNDSSSSPVKTPVAEPVADPRIPLYLFFNASSSIGIVFANKVVFQNYNFKFGTLLTLIHFIFTFLGLEVCRQFGVFERKSISITAVIPLCVAFCGFVALTNVSLVYNSVGFYQLMKVLTTPMIVVIQTIWYNETFSNKIKASLGITCVGVVIGTVTDTEANFIGTVVALSALAITSMYQIWVGTKQKELECNPYQLLYWQAPISALLLVPCVPILDLWLPDKDPNAPPKSFEMPTTGTMGAIFVSSCLAFLVNLSIFLVIGKTSPVTYNVLGHFKLCVILSLGFLFFGNPIDYRNLTGIAVTLAGVFWYTHLKQTKQ